MPYIKRETRERFDALVESLAKLVEEEAERQAKTPAGDLNYIITTLIDKTYRNWGDNYQDFNEKVGILECAKLELYRRRVAPYEDEKIELNGDVFPDKDTE